MAWCAYLVIHRTIHSCLMDFASNVPIDRYTITSLHSAAALLVRYYLLMAVYRLVGLMNLWIPQEIVLVVEQIWYSQEISVFAQKDMFLRRDAVASSVVPTTNSNTEAFVLSALWTLYTCQLFRAAFAPTAITGAIISTSASRRHSSPLNVI